jgi:hypothetical protein
MIQFLTLYPWAYQDEIQAHLLKTFDILTTQSQISRALKRVQFTHKKLKHQASQRNQILREGWVVKLADYTTEQLVFIDESGANERTGDRRWGWAPKGQEANKETLLKCTKNWSILPAYSIDGYIDFEIFQGAYTMLRFEDFIIERVLPWCSQYPGPRSVLVMDNASIHRSNIVRKACREAGVILEFLPPYSPDFNPIELSFKDLKTWIRRHWLEIEDYTSFGDFLGVAVSENGGPQIAKGHFKHCGVISAE